MSAPNDTLSAPETPHSVNELSTRDSQFFQILDSAASGYLLLDKQQCVQRWNAGYLRLFPWQAETIKVGTPFDGLLRSASSTNGLAISPSQLAAIANAHQQLFAHQQTAVEQELPNGRQVYMAASQLDDSRTLFTYRDVLRSEADSESLTFFDALTNLPNRRLLLDRLSQAMIQSERTGWRGALLFIDMEQLKPLLNTISDTLAVQLMQDIARRVLSCVRASDTVARIDREHFVIMLSDLAPDPYLANVIVERLGERLLEELNAPYTLLENTHHISASIGATLYGPHSKSATELLSQAETAMYQLREEGRDNLYFFDPQQRMQTQQRQRMEEELRSAIEAGQFEMHYQPQYSLQGDVTGLEALLRWSHPTRGLVPPAMFMQVAEESGLIVPLGQWSIEATCRQIAQWQGDEQFNTLPVSVNISAQQLQQAGFAQHVGDTVRSSGIDANLLVLELAESLLSQDSASCIETARTLATMGIRVSLDDYGAEESAREALAQMPLYQLKIKQSLVQRLGPNNASEVIVQAAIGTAKHLQLQIVAKGVETLEQRALLAQNACEQFQGYLFSAPVPANQLRPLLQVKPQSAKQRMRA